MKRTLLVLATAVVFLSTLVAPTAVRADGGGGNNTNCGGSGVVCKP